jgi:hypothetical protein
MYLKNPPSPPPPIFPNLATSTLKFCAHFNWENQFKAIPVLTPGECGGDAEPKVTENAVTIMGGNIKTFLALLLPIGFQAQFLAPIMHCFSRSQSYYANKALFYFDMSQLTIS